MARPKPRTNILADIDAATPQTTPEPEPAPDTAKGAPTEPTTPQEPATPAPAKRKYRHKISFYAEPALADQIRGAIVHTIAKGEAGTLTDFANKAFTTELTRLQDKYNDGKPFPPIPRLSTGRPI